MIVFSVFFDAEELVRIVLKLEVRIEAFRRAGFCGNDSLGMNVNCHDKHFSKRKEVRRLLAVNA